MNLSDRLTLLLRSIVAHPDSVRVEVVELSSLSVFSVKVHDDDFGRVIGEHGKTADAIRTVLMRCAGRRRVQFTVEQPASTEIIQHARFKPSQIWKSAFTAELVGKLNDLLGEAFSVAFTGKDVRHYSEVKVEWQDGRNEEDLAMIVRLVASLFKARGRHVSVEE
jgi:predicted RNA-binding protein YlqC (UPF0109 family)